MEASEKWLGHDHTEPALIMVSQSVLYLGDTVNKGMYERPL